MNNEIIPAGFIIGAFGIQGFVKIKTDSKASSDSLSQYTELYLLIHDKWIAYPIEKYSVADNVLNVKLPGITDRDQAMALKGTTVGIARDKFPKITTTDEYYWTDLIGLTVVNQQNETLGQVKNLLESGSNAVLVVAPLKDKVTDETPKDHLIPFVNAYVLEVSLEKKQILVDWGLDY